MKILLEKKYKQTTQPLIKKYLSDFSSRNTLFMIGAFLATFLFYDLFLELSAEKVARPILSKFHRDNYLTDFFVIMFFIFCLRFTFVKFRKGSIPTLNSVVFLVLSLILYKFIISSNQFDFFFFQTTFLANCYYSTPIILGLLLLLLRYKPLKKTLEKKPSISSLIEDNPNPKHIKDSFKSGTFAKSISQFIENTTTTLSFGIAIFGEWGTGKTYLLKQIEQELSSKPHENITIKFNPWRLKNSEGIVEAFFDSLIDVLAPYSSSISKRINDYSDKILGNSENVIERALNEALNFIMPQEPLEKRFISINQTIISTGKRIVIFIDDLDRLTGKEILEVLRLIRNTANFSNTFFIVALDREYLVNSLKNQNLIHNESQYLDKVFQLTLYLPVINKNSFIPLFEETLFTDGFTPEDRHEIKKLLNLIVTPSISIGVHEKVDLEDGITSSAFLSFIETPRDLKRFCNSFKVSFNLTKGYVEITDLFILELIKNYSPIVYKKLRDKSLLSDIPFSNEYDSTFFKEKWDEFIKENKDIQKESDLCFSIKFLLFNKANKSPMKFSIPSNYMNYFSYNRFSTISITDFHQALDSNEDTMFNSFKNWLEEGKDLDSIIYEINSFPNKEALLKFITSLLRLNRSNMFDRAIDLSLRNRWEIFDKYFNKDRSAYSNFLREIIENPKIDSYTRARFCSGIDGILFEYSETDGSKKSVFVDLTPEEITNSIWSLFNEYLSSGNSFKNIHEALEFYYLNEEKVETGSGKIIISQKANEAFRKYLEENKEIFESYIKHLIRSYSIPYREELTMEPFLEQIFSNWRNFKQKLEEAEISDEKMQRLKRIILEYIEENYSSTRRYFKIRDYFDRQFIEDYLGLK